MRVNIYVLGNEKSEKKYNHTDEGRHVLKGGFPRTSRNPGEQMKPGVHERGCP